MTPRLSVVIAWADRRELTRTLRHNRAEFARVEAEVIVACCGGNRELLAHCLSEVADLPIGVVAIDAPFNKSLALNLGASRARGSTLFFLDADLELDAGACESALALASRECAVTLDRVVESSDSRALEYPYLRRITHSIELEAADGRVVHIDTNRRCLADGSRSAPGMVFLRADRFIEVGGMNSDLTGWGWEDLDLLVRLQLGAGMCLARAGGALHLSHGDESRRIDGASRAGNEAFNASMCMANYGLGHYFGTYEDDVATWCSQLAFEPVRARSGRAAS